MDISRRRLLATGAALTALTACGAPVRRAEVVLLDSEETIEDQIAAVEDRHDVAVGLYGVNLADGPTLARRDHELFATCSTFKAYVAGAILHKDQLGELRLEDPVFIDPAALVPVASPITQPHVGGTLPLSVLAAAAVRQSDNTATNLMVGLLGGPPAITEFARLVGDDRTWMVRWEIELNSAIPGDPRDTTTPRAMGTGFLNMLTGPVLDEPHRVLLDEWMRTIVTGDRRIRAGLPPGWRIADKTGSGDYGTTNDIGVASGPNGERLLLSVMTKTRSDDPKAANIDAAIAETAALAVPRLLGRG